MAKVMLGNHTAVYAARSEQDRIRKFYGDVLGSKISVKTDEVDRFQLNDVHFVFVYQDTALDESDFLKAIYLELKTDNTEDMKKKILAFGVKTVDVPIRTSISRPPGGKCLSSSPPMKIFLCMSSQRPRDLELLHPRCLIQTFTKPLPGEASYELRNKSSSGH